MNNKVIIIGAGPAGLSAAITCAENNIPVKIIDEYMLAGGRLLGQLYEEPTGGWWNGIDESEKLYEKALALNVEFNFNTSVNHIEKIDDAWHVHTQAEVIQTHHLLIATGASETSFAIPGWTLPGVMSIGAAQVMTNVHQVKPGEKGVIVGVNVLSSAIAMELNIAGVGVETIALPLKSSVTKKTADPLNVLESLLHVAHMAPSLFVKLGSKLVVFKFMKKLATIFYPRNGVKMWGIPVNLRKAITKIHGTDHVTGVTISRITRHGDVISGTEKQIEADFVCLAGGLYPLAELVALTGCPFYHIESLGGHVPLHSRAMETVLPGLYVAGNVTGVEGAKIAISQGITAGLTITSKYNETNLNTLIEESITDTNKARSEAFIKFHPNIDQGRSEMDKLWQNRN